MQIQYGGGGQKKLTLGTPVKHVAAERARDFYLTLTEAGWDEAFRQLKPETVRRDPTTVGDFIEEVKATADINAKVLEGYAVALRKIVADGFRIDGGREKFDYRGGGRQRWIDRVHRVKLTDLTPAVVQKWKRDFLKRTEGDPVRLRSAKISVNSFLRRAKSLFAPDAMKHLSIRPSSPFEGVKFEKRQSMKYRSVIDVEELTRAAHEELASSEPPVFLAFVLALGAGLRRKEIDRLEWSAFLWDENKIRIEPTRYFDVKTESSSDDVLVDTELMTILRGYAARARSNFVIESPNLPRPQATFEHYRAQHVFERLTSWLRGKGVKAKKPIHELRKEAGSLVNDRHGLPAASDFLRHADIAITAAHYIKRSREATTGIGSLLKAADDEKIIRPQDDLRKGETDQIITGRSHISPAR